MNQETESFCMPIRAEPYAHQQAAFDFACRKFGLFSEKKSSDGVAFLMDMGTGKTITTIAVTGILYQASKIKRVLIAAPLSILPVWEKEFEKFADFLYEMHILTGTMVQKRQQTAFRPSDKLQIIVANYETIWRLEPELLRFHADLVIADEGHKIKENRSKQSKAVQHLGDAAEYKLLLTGTVITNREIDVFSQYRFLNRHIFGDSFYAFRNRYFDMVGYGNHTPKFRESMLTDFLEKMHSVAFRVTKQECLDLPDITEEVRMVELEPDAVKMYRKLEKESYLEIEQAEVSAANVLTKLLRLCQLTGGTLNDDEGNSRKISRAKLNALEDIIDSIMQTSQKLVVMARFVPEIEDIQALLEKKGIGYAMIRGGVKDRGEEVRRFQEDADCRIFIGQIQSTAMGITLTSASTMVFYSLDYSMSNFEQAKARIHRVSQKNDCHYIYLTAKNTIDSRILKALREKSNLAKTLVDDYRNAVTEQGD